MELGEPSSLQNLRPRFVYKSPFVIPSAAVLVAPRPAEEDHPDDPRPGRRPGQEEKWLRRVTRSATRRNMPVQAGYREIIMPYCVRSLSP